MSDTTVFTPAPAQVPGLPDALAEYRRRTFADAFETLANDVYDSAFAHGWWDNDAGIDTDLAKIALMHTELSEAVEALRHGNPPDDKIPEFTGTEAELADTVIRIMDLAKRRGWRVGKAIAAKIQYNAGRPYRHGGKLA